VKGALEGGCAHPSRRLLVALLTAVLASGAGCLVGVPVTARVITDGDLARGNSAPEGCDCPCHRGAVLAHPAPCCVPCAICGFSVATGAPHFCRGRVHPRRIESRGRALFRRLTRYDLVFSASMALAVIALAIYAVPFPGNLVLVAAAALGVVGAVVAILRRGPNAERGRHGS